jgi:hypothetical protein
MHGLRQYEDKEMLLDLSEEMVSGMLGEEYYQSKYFRGMYIFSCHVANDIE